MATHPNPIVDTHLIKHCGAAGYTVAGNVATVTASIDRRALIDLVDGCSQQKFDCKTVAGALTIAPR